ncbi:30S ribosomal protein S17 [Patescibacteria group bacterium]|nr:30S ribosomal protein S17 [Patescibacteria group bacterium]MBU1931287.1 30S ribosomal protein S17 [Patescibacteria group bacterium]
MKRFIGIVTSTKPQKTAVVRIDHFWQHPIYKKKIKRSKKYQAHDIIGVTVGDKVEIVSSRPISKLKRWKVKKVIK